MEERIMYMIVRPDGSLIVGSENYLKRDAMLWIANDSTVWARLYREGFRCKNVKVTYEIIE